VSDKIKTLNQRINEIVKIQCNEFAPLLLEGKDSKDVLRNFRKQFKATIESLV